MFCFAGLVGDNSSGCKPPPSKAGFFAWKLSESFPPRFGIFLTIRKPLIFIFIAFHKLPCLLLLLNCVILLIVCVSGVGRQDPSGGPTPRESHCAHTPSGQRRLPLSAPSSPWEQVTIDIQGRTDGVTANPLPVCIGSLRICSRHSPPSGFETRGPTVGHRTPASARNIRPHLLGRWLAHHEGRVYFRPFQIEHSGILFPF